jgi:hypothetical protein
MPQSPGGPSQPWRVHFPRRKALSFQDASWRDEANLTRSRIVPAPQRDHDPHEHASESAGIASPVTFEAGVTASSIRETISQHCLSFILPHPAHPAERRRP